MGDPKRPELEVIYRGSLVNAQRVWSTLTGHGIEAFLFNAHSSLVGALVIHSVEVSVPLADVEAALEILEETFGAD